MENFTPWSALIGGALIGLSAGFLMLANGRIAGISGILGQLLTPRAGDNGWRIAFLAGLVVAPPLVTLLGLASGEVRIDVSLPLVVLGGLLVGFGTRLGSGCTSGHGVCGLARLSPRSLAATLVFMTVGAGIVFLMRHLIGG